MSKKATGIVAYITLIGWLIAYLAGDKEGAKFHLNQGAVLAIASLVLSCIGWILGLIPIIGFLCNIIIYVLDVCLFVFMIIGIIHAANDEDKELPIIGKIQILK